jgi:hypothetical protein
MTAYIQYHPETPLYQNYDGTAFVPQISAPDKITEDQKLARKKFIYALRDPEMQLLRCYGTLSKGNRVCALGLAGKVNDISIDDNNLAYAEIFEALGINDVWGQANIIAPNDGGRSWNEIADNLERDGFI